MKKQLFTLFVALATTIVSCSDDNDPKPNQPSKLLAKVTETRAGQNTVYTTTYDSQNRLTGFKNQNNTESTTFTYDANGNLTKLQAVEGEESTVFEITYNNGVPVSGKYTSTGDEIDAPVDLVYTVVQGLVTEISYKVGTNTVLKSKITYQNGNVSKVESEDFTQEGEGDDETYKFSTTYTYGTNKNAFPSANFKYVIDPNLSVQFFSKNNVLTEKYDFPGTIMDKEYTNTYTFDAAGYPLTQAFGTGAEATTLKFEYK